MSAMPITGVIKYYGGAAGTLTLDPTERVLRIYAVGDTGDGTLTINGGDAIPIIAGVPFIDAIDSRCEEWVGAVLVFAGTSSYYVKTKTPQA